MHRIGIMLSVLMAMVATVFVAPTAALAVPGCPAETFCMWTDINGTGSRYTYTRNAFILGTNNGIRLLGSGIWNNADSWVNNLGSSWLVNIYDSEGCNTGSWYRTLVNGQYATAQGSDWGNRVSSIQLESASPLTC